MFKEEPSAKERLRKMREAIADLVTDPDWIVLRAEFEAGALRNERIRQTFVEVHRNRSAMEETLSGISRNLLISNWA
jgi:hypothetical protein